MVKSGSRHELVPKPQVSPLSMLSAPHHRTHDTHVAAFLVASVCVHATLLLVLGWLDASAPLEDATERARNETMRVRVIDDARIASNFEETQRTKLSSEQDKKKEDKKEEKKPKATDEPYVTIDELVLEQQPDKARFSSSRATKTDVEQVRKAEPGGLTTAAAIATRARATKRTQIARLGSKSATGQDPQPLATLNKSEPSEASSPATSLNPRKDLDSPENKKPDIILPSQQQQGEESSGNPLVVKPRRGQRRGSETGTDAKTLFPTAATAKTLGKMHGDGGTFNFLQDVTEGDRTLLNRKRNRYWTFWDRTTRRVRREWRPKRELRRRDPFGNVYGVGNFYTGLMITLAPDGAIRQVRVAQSCGLEFLDDEAVRAMLAAGPFPNPPEGLKDEDGLIHIRFGFNMEIISGEVKLFRIKPEKVF